MWIQPFNERTPERRPYRRYFFFILVCREGTLPSVPQILLAIQAEVGKTTHDHPVLTFFSRAAAESLYAFAIAAHVAASVTPVAGRPKARWNALTDSAVFGP